MKKIYFLIYSAFCIFIGTSPAFSQNTNGINVISPIGGKAKWSADPFDLKAFIENKGQFDNKDSIADSNIKYAISNQGTQYYFTSKGWTYRRDESKQLTEEENSGEDKTATAAAEEQEEEREHVKSKVVSHFVGMAWEGANPNVQIIADDKVAPYFTYPDRNDKSGSTSIKALGYSKITYQNLYPGIDVEYTFPQDKPGIKYALIIHPGADLSMVRMHYSLTDAATSMHVDDQGNILIETSFGTITDHAPVSYYADGTTVNSGFVLSNNTVSFKLDKSIIYNLKSKTLIIDPWTTDPSFIHTYGYDAGYDVNYDNEGNVYVYGGGVSDWTEIKFNSAGQIQWRYSTPFGNLYGDFAVDAASGSSYLIDATVFSHQVIKLNNNGTQVRAYTGIGMDEMWRVQLNNCTNQLIIAGSRSPGGVQVCMVDTNFITMTPVNILNTTEMWHDFSLLALDNYGNCFMATCKVACCGSDTLNFDNVLIKCPSTTLLPIDYMVPDHHHFLEITSITYTGNTSNGFNGMAVDNKYVYTYDGNLLQKWDKTTGTVKKSVTLGSTPFTSGGLDVNDGGDIFVGNQSYVLQLDSNFALVATIPLPNTVYDIKLGPGSLLYATGIGFVSSLGTKSTSSGSLNLSVSSTPANCDSTGGAATVTPNGGIGPYSYSWSTGQTTQTATGLSAGTYTVTVVDNGFLPCRSGGGSQTITVVVPGGGGLTAVAYPDTAVCSGASVQLHATPTGDSYTWNTSNGLSDSAAADPIATVYFTTTYTVTVTTGGCSGTATVTVTVSPSPPTPNITQSNDTLYCSFDPTYTSYQWYDSTNIIPGATKTYYVATHNGNYNVAVNNENGCLISVGINVVITGIAPLSFGEGSGVRLFPNPAKNELYIIGHSLIGKVNITITDVLGQNVLPPLSLGEGRGEAILDVSGLANGLYIIQLSSGDKIYRAKFIKE